MSYLQKHPIILSTVACSFAITQSFSYYMDDAPQENEFLSSTRTLAFGTHHEAVHILQKKLKRLKLYDGQTDGNYGVKTEHAVKKFQRRYLIDVTGRANKETIYKLMEIERNFYLDALKTIEDPIYPGSQGEDVKKLQVALQYFGLYSGKIDGIYGPMTQKAIFHFQAIHNLPLQKTVDETFIEKLWASNKNQISHQTFVQKKKDVPRITTLAYHSTVQKDSFQGKSRLITAARAYLGTPYVWGGESPDGFDCSGYLQFVYRSIGVSIPRTVSDIWNSTVPLKRPSVGDLVFFETYKPGPSHAGIYLGDGTFIHAGNNGVVISRLGNSYWKSRYLGARRVIKQ
ncbi:MAG: C40 family peptidase [Bacillaceae bacterium]|nr:C40 family peptidase [Bacillaceae bacterium]